MISFLPEIYKMFSIHVYFKKSNAVVFSQLQHNLFCVIHISLNIMKLLLLPELVLFPVKLH